MEPFVEKIRQQAGDLPGVVWILIGLVSLAYTIVKLAPEGALWRPPLPKGSPPLIKPGPGDWPVLGSLGFFSHRRDWILHHTKASRTGNFSFYFGPYHVVNMSGVEARKVFYHNKNLHFNEGYSALFTGTPTTAMKDEIFSEESMDKWLIRNLGMLLKSDFLPRTVSNLSDIAKTTLEAKAPKPGEEGVLDPFDDIYRLVYHLTVPTFGAIEIVRSPELMAKTLKMFEAINDGSSPAKIIFPWLPTPAHIKQTIAGARFALVVRGILQERKKTGRREDDGLQFLIDNGVDDLVKTVAFTISGLFAGQTNTGFSVAWLLAFLAAHREWYKRVQDEVDSAVRKFRKTPDQSAADVLASLSLAEWESSFPMIDISSRETIRHHLTGTAFRRNISGGDIEIGNTGEVLPDNAVAVYPIDDVHFNPEYYPDPSRWDPGRFLPELEGKADPLLFLGWGEGRHPCLGMRFAKLEIQMITAFFVAMYDFSLEDVKGRPMASPPPIERNHHGSAKSETPIRLRYRLR